MFSATVKKTIGEGYASVTLEVMPTTAFQVRCELTSSINVTSTDDESIPAKSIEVACMSGAAYARSFLPLTTSKIVIRAASGRIASLEAEAFAIATVLAIGRAMDSESLIPLTAFQGVSGPWKPMD